MNSDVSPVIMPGNFAGPYFYRRGLQEAAGPHGDAAVPGLNLSLPGVPDFGRVSSQLLRGMGTAGFFRCLPAGMGHRGTPPSSWFRRRMIPASDVRMVPVRSPSDSRLAA